MPDLQGRVANNFPLHFVQFARGRYFHDRLGMCFPQRSAKILGLIGIVYKWRIPSSAA